MKNITYIRESVRGQQTQSNQQMRKHTKTFRNHKRFGEIVNYVSDRHQSVRAYYENGCNLHYLPEMHLDRIKR